MWTTPIAFVMSSTSATGSVPYFLPLNGNVSLKGLGIHTQWWVADPQSGSFTGLALSNAGTISLW
jgi:hypothetical protein